MKSLKILLFGLVLLLFIAFPNKSWASNFSADYKVTYSVSESSSTRVTFDISLTNSTSDYYAASYKLILGFTGITNVAARDGLGNITPVVEKVKNGTQVGVVFNDKVVGLGKKQNFSISFDTSEIAQHSGNVWEVNIPGISDQNDFTNFNVTVIPPKSAQKLTYIKPEVSVTNNQNVITFNQNQLGNSGISIAYGDYQIYKFRLNYHLENSNLFPIKTEIALPPSTNYQDIQLSDLSPTPMSMKKDKDGNWIAEYYLKSMENKSVTTQGYSKLYLSPRKESLPANEVAMYTRQLPYWEASNAQVKELSKTLRTPRQIYDYVASKLSYDFSRVSNNQVRLGASKVLENPNSAVCLEFTDLFIGLARAAGIPAREVEGFANTQNSKERPLSLVEDILHAWPEYYDFQKNTWVMVDPTWANTTKGVDYFNVLDLDHFAFVIKGIDSQYPVPAGGYKQKGNENVKDVLVEPVSTFPTLIKSVESSIDAPSTQVSYLPIKGETVFRNTGNTISDTIVAKLSSDFDSSMLSINIPQLLPYEEKKIPFSFKSSQLIVTGQRQIKLESPSQVIVKSIKLNFVSVQMLVYLLGGVLIAFIFIVIPIVAYKSWRIYVSRRSRESNIRRQGQ